MNNNYDISEFMTWFIDQFINIWTWFWNILKSIQFNGTNLFYIVIIIIVLRIGVPIVVQLHESNKNDMKIERRTKYDRRRNNNNN